MRLSAKLTLSCASSSMSIHRERKCGIVELIANMKIYSLRSEVETWLLIELSWLPGLPPGSGS